MELYEALKIVRQFNLEGEQKEALDIVLQELQNRPSKEELANLKWQFGVTLGHFTESKDIDKNAKYTRALIYNAQIGYGLVYVIEDFIEAVRSGYFIDSDGMAEALDKDGKEISSAYCNVKSLQQLKEQGCEYIAWFNK